MDCVTDVCVCFVCLVSNCGCEQAEDGERGLGEEEKEERKSERVKGEGDMWG